MRLTSAILLALALVFGVLAYSRSRLPYNKEGRFFDAEEGVVYEDDAVAAYGAISFFFAAVGGGVFVIAKVRSG